LLLEYKTKDEKKAIGAVNIVKFKPRPYTATSRDKIEDTKTYFELFQNEEVWIVKCEKEPEVKQWISSIEEIRNNSGKKGPIFGVRLRELVSDKEKIPFIIEDCIKYMDANLDVVGIFRLSGNKNEMDQYMAQYDQGKRVNLSQINDPHCVAGIMKQFFREMPEPLCTFELYESFTSTAEIQDRNMRVRQLKNLINKLPAENKRLFQVLMEFCARIVQHADKNKMAIHNVATVFGPNLFKPREQTIMTTVQDTPFINSITSTIIQNNILLFSDKELPDVTAQALYAFTPKNESEITLIEGQIVKVLTQANDGWWLGETSDGKVGNFPGSYVKIVVKTKKQQFFEEFENAKRKLEQEKIRLKELKTAKNKVKHEIRTNKEAFSKFNEEARVTKSLILSLLKKENLDLLGQIDNLVTNMRQLQKFRAHIFDNIANFVYDLEELTQFMKNPPADQKKNIKSKSVEKMDSLIGPISTAMTNQKKNFGQNHFLL